MLKMTFSRLVTFTLLIACTPAHANDGSPHPIPIEKPCITFKEGQILFLRGDIVLSAINEESEGQPPHQYYLFLLEEPICQGGDQTFKIDRLEAYPVAPKWLGHFVEIRGSMTAGDAWSFNVKNIKDATPR